MLSRASRRFISTVNRNIRSASTAFSFEDPLGFEDQLSEEEAQIKDAVHQFCLAKLLPDVADKWAREEHDMDVLRELGDMGLLGPTIDGYGCAGMSHTAAGLVMREIERVDSGYRSLASVQSSLVMGPIYEHGTEEQKEKYLPILATGEKIGCFGLTEPDAGSDPNGMKTRAKETSDGYILNGSKTWITNSPIADVFIIWARCDDEKIRGFILEKGTPGLTAPVISGKQGLRTSITGQIAMDDVKVPKDALLGGDNAVVGLKGPFSCLNSARMGIAWGAIGAGEFCIQLAREYCLERMMFGRPLAATQLIQMKLANNIVDLALGLQAVHRVTKLKEEGKLDVIQISIVKRNSCQKALAAAREARDMLGGNGIVDEYHIMRHMCNLEVVNTYEGTSDIHALIIGRAITGIQAFQA